MKKCRYILAILIAAILSVSLVAPDGTPQEKYIAQYAGIAVSEMYRTGVPASITLAQGLLESRAGQSPLASDGNNHFGIKCHDWTGKTQYADDDKKGECFRVYDDAQQSFRDHSDFLRYRDRYKFLFENATTDYKSWAYGLKKAGYATDPAYPAKLIKLIEDYDLSRFDVMTVKEAEKTSPVTVKTSEENSSEKRSAVNSSEKRSIVNSTDKKSDQTASKKTRRIRKKGSYTPDDYIDDEQTTIPQSPLSLEQPKKVTAGPDESYRFSLSRQMYSLNGVPFVYATEGETLASIASSNHLFVKELQKFNDMGAGQEPQAGDIIYLQAKKKQTAKGLDKYIADKDGESLWEISQRFGVKLSDLSKRNSLPENSVLREGDSILLR